jgi:hypothetical protein
MNHENETLDQCTERKFKHLSDQQLINRANAAPDFKWDDESHEIGRRKIKCEMQGNRIVIID